MKYYTYVMLKPDAIRNNLVPEITRMLTEGGFKIEMLGLQTATAEKICRHYSENVVKYGESFKNEAVAAFDGKYVIPMILSSESADIVADVRKFIGATDPSKAEKHTVRGKLGKDSMDKARQEKRFLENLIHASDSAASYQTEIKIWFEEKDIKFYC